MDDNLGMIGEESGDYEYEDLGAPNPQQYPQQRGGNNNNNNNNRRGGGFPQPRPRPPQSSQLPPQQYGNNPRQRGGTAGRNTMPRQAPRNVNTGVNPASTNQQQQQQQAILQQQQIQLQLQQQQLLIQQQEMKIKAMQQGVAGNSTPGTPRPNPFARGGAAIGNTALDLEMNAGRTLTDVVNGSQLGSVGTPRAAATEENNGFKKIIQELQAQVAKLTVMVEDNNLKTKWFWGVVPESVGSAELYEELPSVSDKIFQVQSVPAGTWLKLYYPMKESIDYQRKMFIWARTDSIDETTASFKSYWVKIWDPENKVAYVNNFHFKPMDNTEEIVIEQ